MKIVFTHPFSGKEKGGIAACMPLLLESYQRHGMDGEIISQLWPHETPPEEAVHAGEFNKANSSGSFEHHCFPTKDRSGFGYSPGLFQFVANRLDNAQIAHSHGLWMYLNWATFRAARAQKKPFIVSPHGMLEPWALARSTAKKRFLRALFQDQVLRRAACLHALCEAEAQSIRALGFQTPVAIVPNGVNLRDFASLPPREEFHLQWPQTKGRHIILFLARLHPKKGALPLLESWKNLASDFPEWHLVLAGPDENGYRRELEIAVEQFDLTSQVTFTGMLEGKAKMAALAAAEVFVLPSFSEGFSVALLEAMASKIPLLLTPQCNFPEAVHAGAAFETSPNSVDIEEKLKALLQLSSNERQKMGNCGYELVCERYTWDEIAKEMGRVYYWCLHGGEKPSSIILA